MQDAEPKPPSQLWKDLEDWRQQVKERALQCHRKIKTWVDEHHKPKPFFQLRPKNTPQPSRSAGKPRKPFPKNGRAASWLPDKPIHNCELDVATGEYYCPYGCGVIAEDPWEAMIHEVAHFAEPDEVEEMRKEYEANLAAQEDDDCDSPLDVPATKSKLRKILQVRTLIVFGICLFGWLVWPTPYRYDHMAIGPVSYPVRINRLTGETQVLQVVTCSPSLVQIII